MPPQGGAGLCHLHKRENPLLHPGPTAGTKQDEGQTAFGGIFHSQGDFLPHRCAHGAHKKPAVHDAHHTPPAADGPQGGHHCLREAGFLLGLFQLLRISGKTQGVRSRVFFSAPEMIRRPAQISGGCMHPRENGDRTSANPEVPGQLRPVTLRATAWAGRGLGSCLPDCLHGEKPGPALGKNSIHTFVSSSSRRLNSAAPANAHLKKAVVQHPRIKSG